MAPTGAPENKVDRIMPRHNKNPNPIGPILVIGTDPFVSKRIIPIIEQAGMEVAQKFDPSVHYHVAVVQLPASSEIVALASRGTALISVDLSGCTNPEAPFEAELCPQLSTEEIVRRVNELAYRRLNAKRPPRIAAQLLVMVKGPSRAIQSSTVDISQGGLFVRSLNPFSPGTQVRLRLIEDGEAEELSGKVVYNISIDGDILVQNGMKDKPVSAHPGMAITFDPGQDVQVRRWLSHARGKAAAEGNFV